MSDGTQRGRVVQVKRTFKVKVKPAPRRLTGEERLAAKGLRRLSFVVAIPLWDRFLEKCVPHSKRPNEIFIAMLERAIREASGIPATPRGGSAALAGSTTRGP